MTRHVWGGMLMVALSLSTGCFGELFNEKRAQTVNTPVKLSPANEAASTTAFDVWCKIFEANPEIGVWFLRIAIPISVRSSRWSARPG